MGYWFEREDKDLRYPPRRRDNPIPEGQSFEEMTAKHGKPFGPFDKERLLTYRAVSLP